MQKYLRASRGFTIVELLLVVVVVAILASVSVAAYSGVQQRARDTRRFSDMNAIIKALEMYKVQTGSYPVSSSVNTIYGWEVSSKNPDQFLSALKTSGIIAHVPVDPVNSSTTNLGGFLYRYYRYNAGTNGCDASRGAYYVLVIGDTETSSGQHDTSPGFKCSLRDWGDEGEWITGAYTN